MVSVEISWMLVAELLQAVEIAKNVISAKISSLGSASTESVLFTSSSLKVGAEGMLSHTAITFCADRTRLRHIVSEFGADRRKAIYSFLDTVMIRLCLHKDDFVSA